MNIPNTENTLPACLVAVVCQGAGLEFCSCDTTRQYSALGCLAHFTLSDAECFGRLNHPLSLGGIFSQSLALQVMSSWEVEG